MTGDCSSSPLQTAFMTKKFLNENVASAHKLQNRVRIARVPRIPGGKSFHHSLYARMRASTHKAAKAAAREAKRITATINGSCYACSCDICVHGCIYVYVPIYTSMCFCKELSESIYIRVCVSMSASSAPSPSRLRFSLHLGFGLRPNERLSLHLHLLLHMHMLTTTCTHLHVYLLPCPYLLVHVRALVLASAAAALSASASTSINEVSIPVDMLNLLCPSGRWG